ncbi:hypothetical protein C2G38_2195480 [Gigaspora rosea]|uniref:Uncharacterized protein n=1 Tax=Gigaspora rosea TaxID=44941 RepID=A0A397UYU1_9GLOM|nr:hypothetical protein C2G38_2195480 [Gigaspora rosea]
MKRLLLTYLSTKTSLECANRLDGIFDLQEEFRHPYSNIRISKNISPFPFSLKEQNFNFLLETLILQPQTLITLAKFVKHWNLDPLSQHHSLGITNGNEILLSLQFSTENETQIQNDPLPEPNLEDHTYSTEPIQEDLELEPENNTIDPLSETIEKNIVIPSEPEKTTLNKLIDNLTEIRNQTYIRRDPLTRNTDSEKLQVILNHLRIESHGNIENPKLKSLKSVIISNN